MREEYEALTQTRATRPEAIAAAAATADTLHHCARAVSELADRRLMAMVEPFWVRRDPDGARRDDLDPSAMVRAIAVARPEETYGAWQKALRLPTVRGLVIGRALLYPPGDDVAAAVDTAVGLL